MGEVYSALKIWLHPKITRDVMAELESRADNANCELEGIQAKLVDLQTGIAELRRSNEQLEILNKELNVEIEELRKEIEDRQSTAEQIQRFEQQLEKVEEMKRTYEQRISNLRKALIETRQRIGEQYKNEDELLEIDMREGLRSRSIMKPKFNGGNEDKRNIEDGEWLQNIEE